jgi:phosphinothricin acetyltransferase
MDIRPVTHDDVSRIVEIYNGYICHSTATFEEELVTTQDMIHRFEKVSRYGLPWLVAEIDGIVVGYAYASPWHQRSAYRFTVESSVYLAPESRGKGTGSQLYQALIMVLTASSIRHVIGVVTLPNPESTKLHEKMGFRKVGEFREIGFKFGQALSVSYWQLKLPGQPEGAVDVPSAG